MPSTRYMTHYLTIALAKHITISCVISFPFQYCTELFLFPALFLPKLFYNPAEL